MKHLLFFIILALPFVSCQDDKPKQEIAPVTAVPQADTLPADPTPVKAEEPPAVMANPDAGKATITSAGVSLRKEASIQSEKLGSFQENEKVTVLGSKNVENDKEAILKRDVTVQEGGQEVILPKGKALLIEEYQSERNYYAVTYEDEQNNRKTADIDATAIETITYSTWFQVQRANGETGWVLGKFLKQ